jgi:signal transduction histidine kinase
MKRVAIVYLIAVFVPSLVLAWLAIRSLRDQQFVIERQQTLLYQSVTDSISTLIATHLLEKQREFSRIVDDMIAAKKIQLASDAFDQHLRKSWPMAEIGFCVTLGGFIGCPSPTLSPAAQVFRLDNEAFLCNLKSEEVYWNTAAKMVDNQVITPWYNQKQQPNNELTLQSSSANNSEDFSLFSKAKNRAVSPVQQQAIPQDFTANNLNYSKLIPAEASFRDLVGQETDGSMARFLQNKLKVMFWHRADKSADMVFGAQLDMNRVVAGLRDLIQADSVIGEQICVVLLDERARPLLVSRTDFRTDWKRPFVSTEIGDVLPHWEVAAYVVNPAALKQTARTARLTLGLLIALLVFAISIGGWLIFRSLKRELTLARQKTDFVSNVSHELKTPLTSIRMFSELLAQGRVEEPAKQRSYLNIITAEAARLTRLINNVLDFSRMERGERKYDLQKCDLAAIARGAFEAYRPHLESNGFHLESSFPASPMFVQADSDALAQVIMNLLSNAEKYSDGQKEISLRVSPCSTKPACAEVTVMDRGMGIPKGSDEKIFEKFYRAHDSLASGIQGSGLGLTLARQIARAHGGDVTYEPRPGGGSCFALRIPIREIS